MIQATAGTTITAHGETREVLAVSEKGAITYRLASAFGPGEERMCCQKSWQGWLRGELYRERGRGAA
jgi:hypothetical protein